MASLVLIDSVLWVSDWGGAGELMAALGVRRADFERKWFVALVLAVSPLAFGAVSLFMLPFCFRTCVMPRDAKEYSEVGELNVVRDERNRSDSVGS
jgi:hypothetical protein